jgi:hypothetical protein
MKTCTFVLTVLAISIATPSLAQVEKSTLPSSGNFKIHSGWKSIGESVQLGENHNYGSGNFWGVTYNDAGRGPLHMGAVVCPYTLDMISGAGTAQGTCSWGDSDNDKIFTPWSGKLSPSSPFEGTFTISGGTGKFNGIQGRGTFQCRALNDKGQWTCTQQFEYQLTKG